MDVYNYFMISRVEWILLWPGVQSSFSHCELVLEFVAYFYVSVGFLWVMQFPSTSENICWANSLTIALNKATGVEMAIEFVRGCQSTGQRQTMNSPVEPLINDSLLSSHYIIISGGKSKMARCENTLLDTIHINVLQTKGRWRRWQDCLVSSACATVVKLV